MKITKKKINILLKEIEKKFKKYPNPNPYPTITIILTFRNKGICKKRKVALWEVKIISFGNKMLNDTRQFLLEKIDQMLNKIK